MIWHPGVGGSYTLLRGFAAHKLLIHHNEIWDITADLLQEGCHGIGIEPTLQPATEEQLTHRTANLKMVQDWTMWLRVSGDRRGNVHFFDVQVFSLFAQSHCNTPLVQRYQWRIEENTMRE